MKKVKLRLNFNNEKGMTILEVLIATSILAFISMGIVQITNNNIGTKETIIGEDSEYLQVELAMARIENDFQSIYTPLYFSSKKVLSTASGGEAEPISNNFENNDRFAFSTRLGHPVPIYESSDAGATFSFFMANNKRRLQDVKQSVYAWVHYSVEAATDEKTSTEEKDIKENLEAKGGRVSSGLMELKRSYTAENIYSSEKIDWTEVKSFTLLSNLKAFKFLFWDAKKKEFTETFSNVEGATNYLRAIKVEFIWINKNGAEVNESRIFTHPWPLFEDDTPPDPTPSPTVPAMPMPFQPDGPDETPLGDT